MRSALILASIFLASCASQECRCAKEEKPPHLSLQLPADWKCQLQGVETVCKTAKRDRMIIYTIKERGPTDTLEQYRDHLANAKVTEINGQSWIDSTIVASELTGYTTRYLATVDDRYAALVTLTAQNKIYAKFNEEMRPIVGTLILRR